MSELALNVENLGKRYRIGVAEEKAQGVGRIVAKTALAPFDYLRRISRPMSEAETLWALRGVSFQVGRGEVVGVVGRNGAGKSTLLKLLSRITDPTEGVAHIYGRVGSLLEVGTGFHPELTGRENVYLNGAILGMKRDEIRRQFDEIVDFSRVEKFIDTPVKRYSSGMRVRLAFAVAAHLEPEVVLVDEVLAVGDAAFQAKCLGKMGEIASTGRTVLLVSHNMGAVLNFCPRTIWIDNGRIEMDGLTSDVVPRYLTKEAQMNGQFTSAVGVHRPNSPELKLMAVRVRDGRGEISGILDASQPFHIEIEYEAAEPIPSCRIGIVVKTADGIGVFTSYDDDRSAHAAPRQPGRMVSTCVVPGNLLSPGRFLLSVNASLPGVKYFFREENLLSLDIADTGGLGSNLVAKHKRVGVIRPDLAWERVDA